MFKSLKKNKIFGPTPDDAHTFVQSLLSTINARRPLDSVQALGDLRYQVTFADNRESRTIDLTNGWLTWSGTSDHSERERTLRDLAHSMAETIPAPDASALLPLVRHIGYAGDFAPVLSQAFASGDALPDDYDGICAAPFAGDLIILLAFETASTIASAAMPDLASLDLTLPEALSLAQSNLRARTIKTAAHKAHDGTLWEIGVGNDPWLAPSLLLLPDRIAGHLPGATDWLMCHPARAGLLFCDAAGPDAETHMIRAIETFRTQDHRQSDMVFRWQPAQPRPVPVLLIDPDADRITRFDT